MRQPKRERDKQDHQHWNAKKGRTEDVGRANTGLCNLLCQFGPCEPRFILHKLSKLLDSIAEESGNRIQVVGQRHDGYSSRASKSPGPPGDATRPLGAVLFKNRRAAKPRTTAPPKKTVGCRRANSCTRPTSNGLPRV